MIQVGDKMPVFEAQDQNGNTIKSGDLLGHKTIIYFYPKDNTPGCTAEACNFRDNISVLQSKGYRVIGISKDSVLSHKKFEEKFELPFTLLSDPSTEILQAFGVWGEKKFCGKTTVGTIRTTFVFDENGICKDIIKKIKTADHVNQLLPSL